MPGPPPPCGMQNVLCRLMWQTSAPMSPGRQRPTCAFRLAPSMYTWPPCSWMSGADAADLRLEHAVRRRVRDHQRRERVLVLRRLRGQIGEVDVAAVVAGDDHDAVAGHHRRRGVGAVRGRRDQADVAVPLAAALVVGADDQQAGVLALRAGVRLQRRRGEAGDRGQHLLEAGEDLAVALGLRGAARTGAAAPTRATSPASSRRSRSASSCTSRAGSSNASATDPRLQPAHVAQHLGLGVVRVEHRVRQERARPLAPRRRHVDASAASAARVESGARSARSEDLAERRRRPPRSSSRRARSSTAVPDSRRRLIRRSAAAFSQRLDVGHVAVDADRVEEAAVLDAHAQLLEPDARACPPAGRRARRSRAAPSARDRRRTSRRSPPAAPARCRCCWSPSRAGCAARASAAPCGRRRGRARPR